MTIAKCDLRVFNFIAAGGREMKLYYISGVARKLSAFFIIAIAAAVVLCGCSAAVQGAELFDLSGCESVSLGGCGDSHDVTNKFSVEAICALLSELNYTKIDQTRPPESGILASFQTPNGTVDINVCGEKIGFDGQWYETKVSIGEILGQFRN